MCRRRQHLSGRQAEDFPAFYEKIVEADGVLMVDPIYESGASGLFHMITDRMGPGHDTGMMMLLNDKLKEQGKEPLNPRYFKQKAISFVAIGGSDWACSLRDGPRDVCGEPGLEDRQQRLRPNRNNANTFS